MDNNLNAKKRIMFILKEDYYFLTYNILIILDFLECHSEKMIFKSYNKLPYLITFMSDEEYIELFNRALDEKIPLSQNDENNLFKIYTQSKIISKLVKRLIFALERHNIIELRKKRGNTIDLYIKDKELIKNVLRNCNDFKKEYRSICNICDICKKIRIVKFETFMERIFQKNGVTIQWDD